MTLKSAADKFANIDNSNSSPHIRIGLYSGFLAGASFERARILELLRSDGAGAFDADFVHAESGTIIPSPIDWADWLENRLKEMDGEKP